MADLRLRLALWLMDRWGQRHDSHHRDTCDWNLYREQRPWPGLCNLDCLQHNDGGDA